MTTTRAAFAKALRRALVQGVIFAAAMLTLTIMGHQQSRPYVLAVDPAAVTADRLTAQFHCGDVPTGVIPAHALVRQGDVVTVVSFDAGWKAYTTHDASTVVLSFCTR